jgi:hypothetical protein
MDSIKSLENSISDCNCLGGNHSKLSPTLIHATQSAIPRIRMLKNSELLWQIMVVFFLPRPVVLVVFALASPEAQLGG